HTRFSRDWSSDVCSSDLDMPVFETAGERHEPVILPAVGPPGPKAQVDAMLALMSCTRDRSDVIEQLLAAVVRGLPLIVHNAPPRSEERRVGEEWRLCGAQ